MIWWLRNLLAHFTCFDMQITDSELTHFWKWMKMRSHCSTGLLKCSVSSTRLCRGSTNISLLKIVWIIDAASVSIAGSSGSVAFVVHRSPWFYPVMSVTPTWHVCSSWSTSCITVFTNCLCPPSVSITFMRTIIKDGRAVCHIALWRKGRGWG